MSADAYDFLLKFLIIGESGGGKSCLLHQFIENQFKDASTNTIGVEFGSRIVHIADKSIKLQIWDTAGQERFRSVTRSYYRGAAGALLVYDISNRDTFVGLSSWLTDVRTLASPELVVLLVGNKSDRGEDREVSYLEASRFAQEHELMFMEASAMTGDGVEDTFLKCARSILTKVETGQIDPEKSGTGVQFGDSSLRRMTQRTRTTVRKKERSSCCF
ncbi:Ras-related protein Rab-4B [Umbelopsis nana]